MSGTAKIYDAALEPSKGDIAKHFGEIEQLLGTYRVLDSDGEVGIETYVGTNVEGDIVQLPLSYRSADNALDDAAGLTPLTHSVLGARSVSMATGDPVAVREYISTIVTGDSGAEFSLGEPILRIEGKGNNSEGGCTQVSIDSFGPHRSKGTATINGEDFLYELRFAERLVTADDIPAGNCLSGVGEKVNASEVELARLELAEA